MPLPWAGAGAKRPQAASQAARVAAALAALAASRVPAPALRSRSRLWEPRRRLSNQAARPAVAQDGRRDGRVTMSRFCHGWSIAQLAEGYRYCFDDVLCAHLALSAAPRARRLLDLGSGVGSIGLLWLGQQPRPLRAGACTLLEAQAVSVALCRETLRSCGLEDAVDLRHGDLRDEAALAGLGGGFDVVTANPPYLPAGAGALPRHVQKAYCRHELRGGLLDFCRAAASQLAPGGRFCLVHAAHRAAEVLRTLTASGFTLRHRADILARGRRKSVALVCSLQQTCADGTAGPATTEELEVQRQDGSWSEEWLALCRRVGL